MLDRSIAEHVIAHCHLFSLDGNLAITQSTIYQPFVSLKYLRWTVAMLQLWNWSVISRNSLDMLPLSQAVFGIMSYNNIETSPSNIEPLLFTFRSDNYNNR